MIYSSKFQSPLGGITIASDGSYLTGLWFDGQKYFGSNLPEYHEEKELPVFEQTKEWLDLYFHGNNPQFTPPLSLQASPFRKTVWDILLTIPYGQMMTYGEIGAMVAAQKGIPAMSAQAVGGAVGHNPISLIVPCHRVGGSGGSLTGYAGGIDKKMYLLKLEGIDTGHMFVPKKGTAL